MIDSGATISFIHQNLAKQYNLPLAQQRLDVSLADGSLHTSQHATRLVMQTSSDHFELQSFQLISLGNYSVILGMDWLRKHSPSIDWANKTVSLSCHSFHNFSNLPPLAKSIMPPISNNFDNQSRSCTPPLVPKPTPAKTTIPSIKSRTQPKNPSLINIATVSNASFCQILKQNQGVGL
jgi:hypothetical protein